MAASMHRIGLRIDVDTFRGTRQGVPRLMNLLDRFGIRALFLFSAGPDNMGRNLWRLMKPKFLLKMLRSNAPGLYGWDILLRGTFWPGPMIAKNNADIIRDCARSGHEIGVHAWDHHYWQTHIEKMPPEIIHKHLRQAYDVLSDIIGHKPDCAAVPGWRGTETALMENEAFHFKYCSDCIGSSLFKPMVNGNILQTPQIPRTMPTFDEIIGRNGITCGNYNERLLEFTHPDKLNVLTIHAEVEGGICTPLFVEFLKMARERGFQFCPPGQLLPDDMGSIPVSSIESQSFQGREGWMAAQADSQLIW
ncbi:MAG: 4-deoxy-4-formamido-L-arabinose-phosphoundecaprenol deformylase [Victivallales bacterium]|nr:4-deoxy-4-formamido-L-arabinose-phosphoundecaprenol deformylase [Victivallales bacterium]